MRFNKLIITLLIIAIIFGLQNCIHEYPVPVNNSAVGEKPATVEGFIELNYNLNWEKLIHKVDFSTKSNSVASHRFIVEVCRDGETVIHDVEYVNDEEFATGQFERKLSLPLEAAQYEISAWYDRKGDSETHYFNADDHRAINILNTSTTDTLAFHCAYASDILDLRKYTGEKKTVSVHKNMEMQLPGARFQIVATDVQDFISLQKEALNQGDNFTVHINFSGGTLNAFHTFNNYAYSTGEEYELSGRLRLPFAEYEEITIAQGLVFCNEDNGLSMQISVKNSALYTVSQTDYFLIPIKRGQLTIVKGDFLIHPVDGILHINNIWAGEIYYEI